MHARPEIGQTRSERPSWPAPIHQLIIQSATCGVYNTTNTTTKNILVGTFFCVLFDDRLLDFSLSQLSLFYFFLLQYCDFFSGF